MNTKSKKIAFIGTGAVGMSCLYAAINQNLFGEYGLIDIITDVRDGQVMDFEDVRASMREGFRVTKYEYADLKNVDYIFISAGMAQKPEQTRLDMAVGNIKIMKEIAIKVKNSGFKGLTFIASNPVDVMTYTYIKYTEFDKQKVIGSGTILDSCRYAHAIAADLKVAPTSVQAYVIGEHGDSSVTVFSSLTVGGIPFKNFQSSYNESNYEKELEYPISRKAYEIIKRKRATFYGIGAAITQLMRACLFNSCEIIVAGAFIKGQYGYNDVVFGTPCIIGENGIEQILELNLNNKEKAKLAKSVEILKQHMIKV